MRVETGESHLFFKTARNIEKVEYAVSLNVSDPVADEFSSFRNCSRIEEFAIEIDSNEVQDHLILDCTVSLSDRSTSSWTFRKHILSALGVSGMCIGFDKDIKILRKSGGEIIEDIMVSSIIDSTEENDTEGLITVNIAGAWARYDKIEVDEIIPNQSGETTFSIVKKLLDIHQVPFLGSEIEFFSAIKAGKNITGNLLSVCDEILFVDSGVLCFDKGGAFIRKIRRIDPGGSEIDVYCKDVSNFSKTVLNDIPGCIESRAEGSEEECDEPTTRKTSVEVFGERNINLKPARQDQNGNITIEPFSGSEVIANSLISRVVTEEVSLCGRPISKRVRKWGWKNPETFKVIATDISDPEASVIGDFNTGCFLAPESKAKDRGPAFLFLMDKWMLIEEDYEEFEFSGSVKSKERKYAARFKKLDRAVIELPSGNLVSSAYLDGERKGIGTVSGSPFLSSEWFTNQLSIFAGEDLGIPVNSLDRSSSANFKILESSENGFYEKGSEETIYQFLRVSGSNFQYSDGFTGGSIQESLEIDSKKIEVLQETDSGGSVKIVTSDNEVTIEESDNFLPPSEVDESEIISENSISNTGPKAPANKDSLITCLYCIGSKGETIKEESKWADSESSLLKFCKFRLLDLRSANVVIEFPFLALSLKVGQVLRYHHGSRLAISRCVIFSIEFNKDSTTVNCKVFG